MGFPQKMQKYFSSLFLGLFQLIALCYSFFVSCHRLIKKQRSTLLLLFFFTAIGWLAADVLGLNEKLLNKISKTYGEAAKDRLLDWQAVVLYDSIDLDEKGKLEAVNQFFNQNARFVNDIDHWKTEDYWATPVEFLSTNGGDCEDFSIAKYFTLKEMGVAVEKMRIMYVKAIELNQAHMVLAYYSSPEAEPVILDNLINEIKLASSRTDLVPVYSFNAEGLWVSKERGKGLRLRVGGSERISLWKDLGLRIKNQDN